MGDGGPALRPGAPGPREPFDPATGDGARGYDVGVSALRPAGARRCPMTSPPRPLSQTLLVPLVALVVLIAIVSGIVRIGAVERGYHETMIVGADQLSRGLTSATWHAMLADDRQAAYDTMQVVARQPGISRIRIFNKEGRIMFSTAREAEPFVDKNAEACVLCHASAQPLVRVETPSRARVFTDPGGERRLAMITPIYNEPSCSTAACHAHPARQNVLGVLDVALDLGPTDRLIADARRRVVVTIAIEVALISAFLVAFIGFFVTRPIHRLMEANVALGRMDLEHPIEITSSRELWSLASSFNLMRERLGEALGEINRAAQELEAKVAERTAQLQQAQRRLLQADRLASLGQLAASVAHEINNPLSGVLNFSALMGRILKDGRRSRGSASPSSAATSTGSPSRPRGRGASCPTCSPSRAAPSPSGPRPTSTPSCARRSAWSRTSSSC